MSSAPTQSTIAKELGISRATVAEILGGRNAHRYNDETRRRVELTAKSLGYRPNRQARILTGAKSRVIGIIKSISSHLRNAKTVLHLGAAIHSRGYEVMSGDIYWQHDGLARAVNALLDMRVEGVLLAHSGLNAALLPEIQRLVRHGVPMLCVAGEPSDGFSHITPDYAKAARDIVRHLKAGGYERIAVVSKPEWNEGHYRDALSNSRLVKGVLEAAQNEGYDRAQLEVLPYHILPPPGTCCHNANCGREAIRHLLAQRRGLNIGVIFETDLHAAAAIAECREAGVSVPDEIGVVGMDGGETSLITWPSLTSVRHPVKEMAEAGVDLLFKKIARKSQPEQRIVLPCELIVRGSTRSIG